MELRDIPIVVDPDQPPGTITVVTGPTASWPTGWVLGYDAVPMKWPDDPPWTPMRNVFAKPGCQC